jgi:hypothetical protein
LAFVWGVEIANVSDLLPKSIDGSGPYAGNKCRRLCAVWAMRIEVIKRSDAAKHFEIYPRHFFFERALSSSNHYCRLPNDFEQTIASAKVCLFIGSVHLLTRRISKSYNHVEKF